ncbi:ABC transporter permease [Novibacillus thermophilus]|jgi:putative ABC transport system permease protein|uniref:ABC transporter permease n=1 Tax=Novibacillus thermophilus TaxID=1471761 RepID=A0A1U9K4A9_9BACL|nr:ABC transporter permease [Novibacillus thermophilus]AQS54868.1 ABC transporter permease [Novibacillus thermophilus]
MGTAIDLGLIYAVMALGVYLTFRILDMPDLTVDGSFTTGAAVAAKLIISGVPPLWATLAAVVAGMIAGWITGILHTKGNINGLLAGILTMIGLYSINLRIMGEANLSLLREDTLITPLRDGGYLGTWLSIVLLALIVVVIKLLLDWLLHTEIGLSVQATGDSPEMIKSLGVNTDHTKMLGLSLSNGLVGLSGALIAQYQGFADIGMGIGLILVGLASVIIGQVLFGNRSIVVSTLAVILGSIVYRIVITLSLELGFNPSDMKLISAVLVVLALTLPQWSLFRRLPRFSVAGSVRSQAKGEER